MVTERQTPQEPDATSTTTVTPQNSTSSSKEKKKHRQDRCRPDWDYVVHRYSLTPIGPIPPAIHLIAEHSRVLWNTLVTIQHRFDYEIRRALTTPPPDPTPHDLQVRQDFSDAYDAITRAEKQVDAAYRILKDTRIRTKSETQEDVKGAEQTVMAAKADRSHAWQRLASTKRHHRDDHTTITGPIYQERERTQKAAITSVTTLPYDIREAIENHYKTAVTLCYKSKGEHGMPRYHDETDHVLLRWKHRKRGVPVPSLATHATAGNKLSLDPVPSSAYAGVNGDKNPRARRKQRLTRGRFLLPVPYADVTLHFRAMLHRPLPSNAYLKCVEIVGKRQAWPRPTHPANGWEFYLCLALEIPPTPVPTHPSARIGTLAVNWTHLPLSETQKHEAIRVATITDSLGAVEYIDLPITHLWAGQFAEDPRKPEKKLRAIPEPYIDGWPALDRLQSQYISQATNQVKAVIAQHKDAWPTLPQSTQDILVGFTKLGSRGLLRLADEFRSTPTLSPAAQDILKALDTWIPRNAYLRRLHATFAARLSRYRHWYYEQAARRLCQTYRALHITRPTLKPTRSKKQDRTNKETASNRYKGWAAPGEFLDILEIMGKKFGTDLLGIKKGEIL